MKALIISTSDTKGGAARAAYRLHQGLQTTNISSQMLVQTKHSDHPGVVAVNKAAGIGQAVTSLRTAIDHLPLKRYSSRTGATLSVQWLPENLEKKVAELNPDVVNLHWINSGFLKIETLARLGKPILWTLHDMWPFTGGCHYNQTCDRYQLTCGSCPQLGSSYQKDLTYKTWQRKSTAWEDIDLTVVALSSWLGECAANSSLFRGRNIEIIPNGIDTKKYRPIDSTVARGLLNLPTNRRLILFGSLNAADDRRKGFQLLEPALKRLSKTSWRDKVEVVIFGASNPDQGTSVSTEFGLNTHYLGTLNDDLSLALAYSAADIFVLPSIQENLANTVMESLACGTPCVAFDIGGMPDLIEHKRNGYLVKPYKTEDLIGGITWILDDTERYQRLRNRAREKVEKEFTLEIQGQRYEKLFSEVVSHSRGKL